MGDLPPLVEPGPPLRPERLNRFSRQLLMPGFGELAQRRLANARVLVVGAGGLGSASVPYLAAAGVGTIGVVDSDTVELSNLHRQVSHRMADVGRSKVDSLADTIAGIDPEVAFRPHKLRLEASNIMEILNDYDLVMDGSDNYPTRYLTNDAAVLSRKPLVWGAILRYSGQAGVVWAEHGPNYRDLFPTPPGPSDALSCADGGVLPSVCAAIGAIMSTEAIKLICGIGDPLIGRVTTYDALSGRYREISYGPSPDAAPITGLVDYELFCGLTGQTADAAEKATSPAADHASSSATSREPAAGDVAVGAGTGQAPLPRSIDANALAQHLSTGTEIQVVDVREPFEARIAAIAGSELVPLGGVELSLHRIRRDVPVVVYCHHGIRSQRAMNILEHHGFTNISNLEGGIDAFAARVDPAMARY